MRSLAAGLLSAAVVFAVAPACAQSIETIAGDGIAGRSGGKIDQPFGLAIGPDGKLYFCEVGNHRISRLDLKSHAIQTVAGTGQKGNAGDGGPAKDAQMDEPYEIAFDPAGDLFFCDRTNHVVRRISRKTGFIETVAGTGKEGYAGDNGPAASAQFRQPHSIAFAPDGHLLICDILNFRIRSFDLRTGTITTWAGTGARGNAEDGATITGTPLDGPRALAIDQAGNFYLALREGNAIYRMDVKQGRMYRFAGTGEKGYSGDGGEARTAKLSGPKGVACGPDGSLYIADTENHAIRRVDSKGVISTVAGTGERGDGPDGDPLRSKLARPHGVFVDSAGVLYISDTENHRVRIIRNGSYGR
jgi:sugar lactone lactonase YvrE